MSRNIQISICCITYNQEKYISQTIEGFLKQSILDKTEIIIHDDCSTDTTPEIIKKYAEQYPEIIKPILQKENQYSKGKKIFPIVWEKAQGEYIAICEGDDFWQDSQKLEKQLRFLKSNSSYSMIFSGADLLYPEGNTELYLPGGKYDRKINTEEVIKNGGLFCPTASLFFRKKDIINLPDYYYKAEMIEDYPLQLLLASKGDVYYFATPMVVYRTGHASSWVKNTQKDKERQIKVFLNEMFWLRMFNEKNKNKYNKVIAERNIIYALRIKELEDKNNKISKEILKQNICKLSLIKKFKTLIKYYIKL